MRPCFSDVDVIISQPHFLNSGSSIIVQRRPDSLDQEFEGLDPDPETHSTFLHVDPELGLSTHADIRYQVNFDIHFLKKLGLAPANVPNIFPVFWKWDTISASGHSLKPIRDYYRAVWLSKLVPLILVSAGAVLVILMLLMRVTGHLITMTTERRKRKRMHLYQVEKKKRVSHHHRHHEEDAKTPGDLVIKELTSEEEELNLESSTEEGDSEDDDDDSESDDDDDEQRKKFNTI